MKILLWPVIGCTGAADLSVVSFTEALAAAEQAAPALSAAAARHEAARHVAVAAGELPDPKLVLGLDNLPVSGDDNWSLSRDFMTMQRVGVSQDLPNAGKRKARVALADAAIADTEFATRIARLKVRRETALAWLAAYFAGARLVLLDALVTDNGLFERSIAARHAAGTASASDVLLPKREALMLAERRDDLSAAQASAEFELERLLGHPVAVAADAEPPQISIDSEHLRTHLSQHSDLLM